MYIIYHIIVVDTDFYFIDGSTDPNIAVTIPMGSTTHDVSFTVRNDTIIETDETFALNIFVPAESSSLGVLLGGNSGATVTLQDDDDFGTFVKVNKFREFLEVQFKLVTNFVQVWYINS